MKFLKELKEFAMKGNVLDLAVGVIIGGAFGKIVSSLVADVIMPPLSWISGGVNLTSVKWILKAEPLITLNIGNFLQNIIDFAIIALSIFIMVKMINKFKRKEEAKNEPAKITKDQELLIEIRDLLKK